MDTITVNNLISFVACAIAEGDKDAAIFQKMRGLN